MSDPMLTKTDHLLLIIGTSPLPNYVAAYLLTKPRATAHLLHSPETAQVANHLVKVLAEVRSDLQTSLYPMEESDRMDIERVTGQVLSSKSILPGATLGLNYTGGTKPMATHIYRTVKEKWPQAVFTYLDARNLQMWVDGEGANLAAGYPVAGQVKISFKNLAALHGRELESAQSCTDILFPEVCKKLADAMLEDAPGWRYWCDRNLRKMKKLPIGWEEKAISLLPLEAVPAEQVKTAAKELLTWAGSDSKEENKSRLRQVLLPNAGSIATPFSSFSSDSSIRTLGDLFSHVQNEKISKIEHLSEWLEGKWLEHYVLDCLNQSRQECGLDDIAMSLVMAIPGKPNFEVDVAAMHGYQLFAISCTTDLNLHLNQSKLFEIFTRARQFGGEEARFGIVSCYDKPKELEQKLREEWQAEHTLKVFGRDDLPNLKEKLAEWIKTANH